MWCNSVLVKLFLSHIIVDAEASVDYFHLNWGPWLRLSIEVCALLKHLTNVVDKSTVSNQFVALLLLLVVQVHQMSINLL